ncbi:MAG TPA: hypothetical protein VGH87_15920 [Polyangiaceae bacterium]|jgi:hypothetical protein|nr:hypothetical protein [Polyangiaceae bacterium]
MSDTKDQVHRDLVANLDDEEALEKMQKGWLAAGEWASAIERMRTRRFADLPVAEGNRRVGALLGERFLASYEGQLARKSIETLPKQVVFGKLVPMLGERLRQSIRFEWVATDSGGILNIRGRRATPAEVTLGFFETIAGASASPPVLALEIVDDELMILHIDGP